AKIHRPGRDQHAHPARDRDHAADTRMARSTSASSVVSVPLVTRTAAPASLISMLEAAAALLDRSGAASCSPLVKAGVSAVSGTIGTKLVCTRSAASAGKVSNP